MFSSTAYEAFYTYIGVYLHEASIKINHLPGGFNWIIDVDSGSLLSSWSLAIFFKIHARHAWGREKGRN